MGAFKLRNVNLHIFLTSYFLEFKTVQVKEFSSNVILALSLYLIGKKAVSLCFQVRRFRVDLVTFNMSEMATKTFNCRKIQPREDNN